MKKIITIMVMFLMLFSLTACKETDAIKFKKEYESLNYKKSDSGKKYRKVKLSRKNSFIYSDAKEISKKIDNGDTFIVYFGFSKCPWCRSVISSLDKVARDTKYEKIYYVDVLDIRDTLEVKDGKVIATKKGDKYYNKLLKQLDLVLDDYSLTDSNGKSVNTNEKRIYAPNVVAVANGKPIKLETGVSKDQKDAYMTLTDKMQKETYNKFKCLIKCLLKESSICESKTSC